jgi:hypothetical protein
VLPGVPAAIDGLRVAVHAGAREGRDADGDTVGAGWVLALTSSATMFQFGRSTAMRARRLRLARNAGDLLLPQKIRLTDHHRATRDGADNTARRH